MSLHGQLQLYDLTINNEVQEVINELKIYSEQAQLQMFNGIKSNLLCPKTINVSTTTNCSIMKDAYGGKEFRINSKYFKQKGLSLLSIVDELHFCDNDNTDNVYNKENCSKVNLESDIKNRNNYSRKSKLKSSNTRSRKSKYIQEILELLNKENVCDQNASFEKRDYTVYFAKDDYGVSSSEETFQSMIFLNDQCFQQDNCTEMSDTRSATTSMDEIIYQVLSDCSLSPKQNYEMSVAEQKYSGFSKGESMASNKLSSLQIMCDSLPFEVPTHRKGFFGKLFNKCSKPTFKKSSSNTSSIRSHISHICPYCNESHFYCTKKSSCFCPSNSVCQKPTLYTPSNSVSSEELNKVTPKTKSKSVFQKRIEKSSLNTVPSKSIFKTTKAENSSLSSVSLKPVVKSSLSLTNRKPLTKTLSNLFSSKLAVRKKKVIKTHSKTSLKPVTQELVELPSPKQITKSTSCSCQNISLNSISSKPVSKTCSTLTCQKRMQNPVLLKSVLKPSVNRKLDIAPSPKPVIRTCSTSTCQKSINSTSLNSIPSKSILKTYSIPSSQKLTENSSLSSVLSKSVIKSSLSLTNQKLLDTMISNLFSPKPAVKTCSVSSCQKRMNTTFLNVIPSKSILKTTSVQSSQKLSENSSLSSISSKPENKCTASSTNQKPIGNTPSNLLSPKSAVRTCSTSTCQKLMSSTSLNPILPKPIVKTSSTTTSQKLATTSTDSLKQKQNVQFPKPLSKKRDVKNLFKSICPKKSAKKAPKIISKTTPEKKITEKPPEAVFEKKASKKSLNSSSNVESRESLSTTSFQRNDNKKRSRLCCRRKAIAKSPKVVSEKSAVKSSHTTVKKPSYIFKSKVKETLSNEDLKKNAIKKRSRLSCMKRNVAKSPKAEKTPVKSQNATVKRPSRFSKSKLEENLSNGDLKKKATKTRSKLSSMTRNVVKIPSKHSHKEIVKRQTTSIYEEETDGIPAKLKSQKEKSLDNDKHDRLLNTNSQEEKIKETSISIYEKKTDEILAKLISQEEAIKTALNNSCKCKLHESLLNAEEEIKRPTKPVKLHSESIYEKDAKTPPRKKFEERFTSTCIIPCKKNTAHAATDTDEIFKRRRSEKVQVRSPPSSKKNRKLEQRCKECGYLKESVNTLLKAIFYIATKTNSNSFNEPTFKSFPDQTPSGFCSTCMCKPKKKRRSSLTDERIKINNTIKNAQCKKSRDYELMCNRVKCLDKILQGTLLEPYLDYLLNEEPISPAKNQNLAELCPSNCPPALTFCNCTHKNPLIHSLGKYLKRDQPFDETITDYLKFLKKTSCSYNAFPVHRPYRW